MNMLARVLLLSPIAVLLGCADMANRADPCQHPNPPSWCGASKYTPYYLEGAHGERYYLRKD